MNFFREIVSAARENFAGWSIEMRYAVSYLVMGMAWIHLEHHIIPGENYVLKDSLFIITTALAFYLIVGRGVGKLHRSEEALKESEERLARILETNASGIIVLDREGIVTFVNRAAETILDLPGNRIIGRKYTGLEIEVTNLDDTPDAFVPHPFAQVMSTGRPVCDVEFLLRRPGGIRSTLSVNAAPLRDASGEAAGIVASVTDITERKKAQIQSLRGAAREEFPVGGLPYSEMREGIPRLLDGISESSRRIKDIVDNLKEFAAQDRSALDCPVDLNAVTRAAVSILDHEIVHRTRRFAARYGEPLPMVLGRAQHLEQVVLNLVVNALKALPDPSHAVKVETGMNRETGCVEIRVSDEGVGMPVDAIRRLGEPFYTTKSDRGGLGLGLSICASIVKAHNGAMTFRSEVGKGMTACVSIPAAMRGRDVGSNAPASPG